MTKIWNRLKRIAKIQSIESFSKCGALTKITKTPRYSEITTTATENYLVRIAKGELFLSVQMK
jgi:hypothetical protein